MRWQSILYREDDGGLQLEIEPMFQVPDVVYVPSENQWAATAPAWARGRRLEILGKLKGMAWHRDLEWREGENGVIPNDHIVPGSLESTQGGGQLLAMRLFDPNSQLTSAQARQIWQIAVRQFAEQASGTVSLFIGARVPGSVFEMVALPALKKNPNVTLEWH